MQGEREKKRCREAPSLELVPGVLGWGRLMAPPLGAMRHHRGELALWGTDPKSGLSQREFGMVTKHPGGGGGCLPGGWRYKVPQEK